VRDRLALPKNPAPALVPGPWARWPVNAANAQADKAKTRKLLVRAKQ